MVRFGLACDTNISQSSDHNVFLAESPGGATAIWGKFNQPVRTRVDGKLGACLSADMESLLTPSFTATTRPAAATTTTTTTVATATATATAATPTTGRTAAVEP